MRLIDADDLLELFDKECARECDNCVYYEKCIGHQYCGLIDKAPTIEERPKGKWLKSSNMSKRSYQRLCSNCKHIVYFCGDGNYPNCPYCLADMRGEENG